MTDARDNPYRPADLEPTPTRSRDDSDSDPSVFHEPHMAQSHFREDKNDSIAPPIPDAASAKLVDAEQIEHGVWDEPGLSSDLAGEIPIDAMTYDRWLSKNIARTTRGETWRNACLVALAAGPWSIVGALAFQMTAGTRNQFVLMCVVGPVSEEIMKIAASLWVIEKRPFMFSSKTQILVAAALSGLSFAAIENMMYLNFGLGVPPPGVASWRWTVCVALHVTCSLIAGLGLAKVWEQTLATQTRPALSLATSYLLTAMTIHGVYNLMVSLL